MKSSGTKRKLKKKPVIISSLTLIAVISFLSVTGLLWPKFDTQSFFHIKVVEGMRKEEIADTFSKTLGWSYHDTQTFLAENPEGYIFPTTYDIPAKSNPNQVSTAILTTFTEQVVEKQEKLKTKEIDTDTAIKIASIIEREAYGKKDMNIISGIIWNRLKKNMRLEMDATLQYAKGSTTQWWPTVQSIDKNIDSPFNTYMHAGLPPTAIASPSADAIDAALHPAKTKALFYIHDRLGYIHTADTYSQHLANITQYLW